MSNQAILIRRAFPDDQGVLARLATLDSQRPLEGDALIAEIDGVAVAALSLSTARVVADPFVHTGSVRELLRIRADAIARPQRRATRAWRRAKLAPAAVR